MNVVVCVVVDVVCSFINGNDVGFITDMCGYVVCVIVVSVRVNGVIDVVDVVGIASDVVGVVMVHGVVVCYRSG